MVGVLYPKILLCQESAQDDVPTATIFHKS